MGTGGNGPPGRGKTTSPERATLFHRQCNRLFGEAVMSRAAASRYAIKQNVMTARTHLGVNDTVHRKASEPETALRLPGRIEQFMMGALVALRDHLDLLQSFAALWTGILVFRFAHGVLRGRGASVWGALKS